MHEPKILLQSYQVRPTRFSERLIGLTWLGGFLATAAFAIAHFSSPHTLILGSFGASCLLIFAYPNSPLVQPKNVIGGHFIASLTGLACLGMLGVTWWSMALAVGIAIALMWLLRVPHPPASANPLIVMLAGAQWDFLLVPTLFGSLLLVVVALVYNNLGGRRYPTYWW